MKDLYNLEPITLDEEIKYSQLELEYLNKQVQNLNQEINKKKSQIKTKLDAEISSVETSLLLSLKQALSP